MCFGIPCKIEKVNKNKATVKNGGKIFDIDISLLPKIKKGDWILVQGDTAMRKISEKEAERCLAVFREFESGRKKGGV